MHLQSLTLKGFKSFPNRTQLKFGQGVSVVVGPNGSGKSNITDALLWVLGEQSPSAIRGQTMQDVIFGGGHGHKAKREAEVEVVLDNSDGTVNIDLTEISIVRKLNRDGEGEYRLNGARCRLVDVIEVLSDTGLGKEAHSVVSQGRVEAIVTSKPQDRRLLIEEAAGLGKHRKRRRRAQLKLGRTQENLDRAADVEREARTRLRPLKRQAEAAEHHQRLLRQITEMQYELARDTLRGQRVELEAVEQRARAVRAERDQVEQQLTVVAAQREQAEQKLAARSSERSRHSQRFYSAQTAHERLAFRQQRAQALASELTDRITNRQAGLAALTAEAEQDQPNDQHGDRVAALTAALAASEREREAELERELAALKEQLAAAEGAIAAQRVAIGASETQLEQYSEAHRVALEGRAAAERILDKARGERAKVGSKLAGVNQFLRLHAGVPGGAQALADQLKIKPGYELALAAVLGRRLRAGIVDDIAAGLDILSASGDDGGSALVVGGPENVNHGAPPVAAAESLLSCLQADVPSHARLLLADVWVVDSLQAIASDYRGTAVTKDGEVWFGVARELRRVPAGGEDRVLAERNRRDELIAASANTAQAEQVALVQVEQAAGAVVEARRERDEADQAVHAARHELRRREQELKQLQLTLAERRRSPDHGPGAVRRAELKAELDAERRHAQQAERTRRQRAERIAQVTAMLAFEQRLQPVVVRLCAVLEPAIQVLRGHQRTFEQELERDRAAGEQVAAELRAHAQQEAKLQGQLKGHADEVTMAEVKAQSIRDQASAAKRQLSELAEHLGLPAEPNEEPLETSARAEYEQKVARLERRREQLGPVNPLAQQEYDEALAHVEELETQRTDLETALRELKALIRETDREIRENFEATFNAAAENFREVAQELFPGGKGRLRLVADQETPASEQKESSTAEAAADTASDEGETMPDKLPGVEIEITPAGKSMKRLSLLSGGEKSMTALAFLFSVFLARPCPFYVLDEVEAALDDINIDRFLKLLGRYAGRAQFIVVTHQKRTMDAADYLYGVSMSGDGVSKVISRRLPAAQQEPLLEDA